MGMALFLIGILAIIAGIVLFIIALVRKKGWGIVRSLAIGVVGIILAIIGMVVGIAQEVTKPKPEVISPTITSIPESTTKTTSAAEVGKSRLNPVPYGSSLTYGDQRITVTNSKRISEIGWSKAGYKNIYLVVNVKVDFLNEPSEKRNYLYISNFRLVGNSGHIYDSKLYPETDTPLKNGEFYGGASTSGDLLYEIEEQETNLILIWNCGLGVDRYLKIP